MGVLCQVRGWLEVPYTASDDLDQIFLEVTGQALSRSSGHPRTTASDAQFYARAFALVCVNGQRLVFSADVSLQFIEQFTQWIQEIARRLSASWHRVEGEQFSEGGCFFVEPIDDDPAFHDYLGSWRISAGTLIHR